MDDFPEGTANKLVATVTKMCPESATISITSRGGILVKCTKGDLEKVEASLKRVKINGKDLELNVRDDTQSDLKTKPKSIEISDKPVDQTLFVKPCIENLEPNIREGL